MPRRVDCPWGGWIELPDEWLGEHAARRDEAYQQAEEKKLPQVLANFAVALALLENWEEIPGLAGNPEKWELGKVAWPVIAWITGFVFGDIARALEIPKNS